MDTMYILFFIFRPKSTVGNTLTTEKYLIQPHFEKLKNWTVPSVL